MLTSLLASILLTQSAMDRGVLIGLRNPTGGYRTLLVARRGVAYLNREHKGELLRPMKEAVHNFRMNEGGFLYQGRQYTLEGKFRIAWAGVSYIGLEFNASNPGEPTFGLVRRRVVHVGSIDRLTDVKLSETLNSYDKERLVTAAETARKFRSGLPSAPDELDWGYERFEGKWQFVGALSSTGMREEFTVPGRPITSNPPLDYGDIPWRTVTRQYPDAEDIVSSREATFAVVVTSDFLYVHEATRTSIGRLVRRIPCKNETVVCLEFGGAGPLEAWLKYVKG